MEERKLVRQLQESNTYYQQYDDGSKVALTEIPDGIEANPERRAQFEEIYATLTKKLQNGKELNEDEQWMLEFFAEKLGK